MLVLGASCHAHPATAQQRVSSELRVGGGYDSNPALAAGAGNRRLPSGGRPTQREDGVFRLQGALAGRLGTSPGLVARLDVDGHVYGSGAFVFWERLAVEASVRVDDVAPRCRGEGSRLDISITDDSAWSLGIACGAMLRLPESLWLAADARGGLRAFDSGQVDAVAGGDLAFGWAPEGEPVALEVGLSALRRESNERTASRVDVTPWVAVRVSTEHVGGQLVYSLVGRVFDRDARSGWEQVGRLEAWGMPLPWLGAFVELEVGHAEGGPQALEYTRAQAVVGVRLALDWRSAPPEPEPSAGPAAAQDDGWVEFRFHLPDADRVSVVGDFNDWDPRRGRLERSADGSFTGRLRLGLGRHEYHLMVDGRPMVPPGADRYVTDDFGGENAVVVVAR